MGSSCWSGWLPRKCWNKFAVVMCSTSPYQDDILKATRLGACGYLTKPADFVQLKLILRDATTLEFADGDDAMLLLRTA